MIIQLFRYSAICLLCSATLIMAKEPSTSDSSRFDCPVSCQTAFNQIKKFARNGSPHAQTLLALTYRLDHYEQTEAAEQAWRWLNIARSQSFPPAMYYASHWHREGYNISINVARANELLERSAAADYPPAVYELAIRQLSTADSNKGINNLKRAADLNNASAVSLLERFETLNINLDNGIQLDATATADLIAAIMNKPLFPAQGDTLKPERLFVGAAQCAR